MARDQFAVPIECSACGQTGSVEWDRLCRFEPGVGFRRRLALVSKGFHNEFASTPSRDPKIVCDACGIASSEREPT
jgi:hypothetical protein